MVPSASDPRAGVVVGAGAKVLGGVIVGDAQTSVSNAVVVKRVPARATCGGHPRAHCREGPTRSRREVFGNAGVQDQDDPYAKAIQNLVEHSAELEQALASSARSSRISRKTSKRTGLERQVMVD